MSIVCGEAPERLSLLLDHLLECLLARHWDILSVLDVTLGVEYLLPRFFWLTFVPLLLGVVAFAAVDLISARVWPLLSESRTLIFCFLLLSSLLRQDLRTGKPFA